MIFKLCFYILALCTMFLSILWAVLTSDATTYALIGWLSCAPIDCANWFVPPCPTILNDAGIEGTADAVAPLPPDTEPPPYFAISDLPFENAEIIEAITAAALTA